MLYLIAKRTMPQNKNAPRSSEPRQVHKSAGCTFICERADSAATGVTAPASMLIPASNQRAGERGDMEAYLAMIDAQSPLPAPDHSTIAIHGFVVRHS